MPPPSVHVSDSDLSHAFYDQFSTVIRLESHLHGDHSEDVMGPARRRWVVRHLAEVAQAQSSTSVPTQATTLNVHAQDFVSSSPAQTMTSNIGGYSKPWFENFNLVDQGLYNASLRESHPSGPASAFNPVERAEYRAAVRAQLVDSSNQALGTQTSKSSGRLNYTSSSSYHPTHNNPRSQPPSTLPTRHPRVRYPSTPPNPPPRHHHRRQTSPSSPDSSLEPIARNLRASTEPPLQPPRMGTFTAPDHYQLVEIYALEVKIGDYIQSVKNPGM